MRKLGIVALALFLIAGTASAANVGFLVKAASPGGLGAEGKASYKLARERHTAGFVRAVGGGKFVDASGKPQKISAFGVIWYHQGDDNAQSGPIYDGPTLKALKAFVNDGGSLYLSGAALAMVNNLGIEPNRPRTGGPGNDSAYAGLIPVNRKHPVFSGLKFNGGKVDLSNRGHPAYSDFHGSRISGGMLLANSPGAGEKPMAEYAVGKGRIIVMGWRLPHYSYGENPHRANLEKLTANIIGYLGDKKQWQKVVAAPAGKIASGGAVKPSQAALADFDALIVPLERAIKDLSASYGKKYAKGAEFMARLEELKGKEGSANPAVMEKLTALRREALLANPLLDFQKILLVRRTERNLAMPANWQSNSSLRHTGYKNDIVSLTLGKLEDDLEVVFKPEGDRFVGDVDLHFNGDRMLFSMPGKNNRWQVYEAGVDGGATREMPLIIEPDVDNYDACYLPNGNIIFTSTAPFVGVPCVGGSSHVTNIYLLDTKTGKIRRLTVDQEHNWCPTILNNGRVMYLRWEYSDIPHYVGRILFHMNPDGTNQSEYYGSNSYWPNAIFYARPVPGHPTMVAGIVTGHHGVKRIGELVLFDPAKGRFEADGVVQRIPGYGKKVEPVILDGLVNGSWPKFLHPYPLSAKYFLVSAQLSSRDKWGLYLVDVFDNILSLRQESGFALLEPIPIRKTPVPPVVPQRVDLARKDATVFITDIYEGPGLKGVPRGTVKNMRLFTYHYAYHGMGGQQNRVGMDGPWDVKRVLGTVPVEKDGSAFFRVPANVPISFQPLDAEGKAIQIMRSWTTAMPGENVSCVGCHEPQNMVPPTKGTIASRKRPVEITPWLGKTRGFSFVYEVQPVLDRYCVGCHNGEKKNKKGALIANFTHRPAEHPEGATGGYRSGTKFTPSYMALRRYVRTPTIESDMHLNAPYEWHADTTKLFQMLNKGHSNVKLDAESLDRLITWFDLGAPAHGTWQEVVGMAKVDNQSKRRRAMMSLYAGINEDPEEPGDMVKNEFIMPPDRKAPPRVELKAKGWPFSASIAKTMQKEKKTTIDLGEGISLELVHIPPGEFVIGNDDSWSDEGPRSRVRIDRPFWMGAFEISNEQYARFDPKHDSRLEHGDFLQFSVKERGDSLNQPRQPVTRVSWAEAKSFCAWLSAKTGEKFDLPSEAQWEWACRAGTDTAMWFGTTDTDFGKMANLADINLKKMPTLGWGLPSGALPDWRPSMASANDGAKVSATMDHCVATYAANPWGLFNMHGNVAEWTRSVYAPYPYVDGDGRNSGQGGVKRVARGGSWYERPERASSSYRVAYEDYQKVFSVGFRVVCEE